MVKWFIASMAIGISSARRPVGSVQRRIGLSEGCRQSAARSGEAPPNVK
jgi:hypothetical protein